MLSICNIIILLWSIYKNELYNQFGINKDTASLNTFKTTNIKGAQRNFLETKKAIKVNSVSNQTWLLLNELKRYKNENKS